MALGICGERLTFLMFKSSARLKNGPATVVADNAYHATEFASLKSLRLGRQATDEAMSQETDRLREHHVLRGKGVRRMHAFGFHRSGCGFR